MQLSPRDAVLLAFQVEAKHVADALVQGNHCVVRLGLQLGTRVRIPDSGTRFPQCHTLSFMIRIIRCRIVSLFFALTRGASAGEARVPWCHTSTFILWMQCHKLGSIIQIQLATNWDP